MAVPTVAAATRPLGPSFAVSLGNAKSTDDAPAPIAPSKTPYSVGPPPICVRATRGNSAQYALANKKKPIARNSVARKSGLWRA